MPENWTPKWARKVTWYQIFPERFRNGDPSNDPTIETVNQAYPFNSGMPWEPHPWGADWFKRLPYELAHDQPKTHWHNLRRRYGGDLQGILDKLDYIQDLGISALYINPIFDAASHHKYDGNSYHHVDVHFGPDPVGDRALIASETPHDPSTWVWTSADKLFLQLIKEVHARGMRIIIDGVFNHMGTASWVFRDVREKQQQSAYKDWLKVKSWDDPEKGTNFEYSGWFGTPTLPELNQDENGLVAGPKQYVFDCTRRWMAPHGDLADGVDGWRLDVAFCIRHPFWKDWRSLAKSINPEVYLTAEVIDTIEAQRPYLEGDEFDAVMNYGFAWACHEFMIQKDPISASEFDQRFRDLRDAFGPDVAFVQQNLFTSHDTARLSSMIANPDTTNYRDFDNFHARTRARENPAFVVSKPGADAFHIQKLLAVFQMTYLGAPMIYYGDEVGMWGGNDPGCRKPMLWDDIAYEPEATDREGQPTTPETVAINQDLLAHYKKLIKIRNEHTALQLGDFKTLLIDDERAIYAFSRTYEGETIVVVLNNAAKEQPVRLPIPGEWTDLLNDEKVGSETAVAARWARVLKPA